ncbi:hypothetical protein LCGC14_2118090, partial [marine sediment metagenome]
MNNTISGFVTGLFMGAALSLTGGWFFGTSVLRKTLREHDNERRPSTD